MTAFRVNFGRDRTGVVELVLAALGGGGDFDGFYTTRDGMAQQIAMVEEILAVVKEFHSDPLCGGISPSAIRRAIATRRSAA
jgi:hypothetical protein